MRRSLGGGICSVFVVRNDEGNLAVDSEVCVRMYRPDGFHLTAEGHAYCADQLAEIVVDAVSDPDTPILASYA